MTSAMVKATRLSEGLVLPLDAVARRLQRRPVVPVSLTLMVFVVLCMAIPALRFLFGGTSSRLAFPAALAASVAACWMGRGELQTRLMRVREVVLVIVMSVIAAGASFMYSNPDADAYHRPAVMLMSRGWNPVFDATVEQVAAYAEPTGVFRYAHAAYLPRGAWYYGLALYESFGFVEVADSINVLLWLVSLRLVWAVVGLLGTMEALHRRVSTVFLASSPVVCNGMFGGSFDSALYSLFLISTCGLTLYLQDGRRLWLAYALLAMASLPSLKYTGAVVCGIVAAVFTIAAVARSWQRTRWNDLSLVAGVAGAVVAAAGVAAVINFSPYLTSWARYGGPFYPIQTFDHRLEIRDTITDDFAGMNEDARQMGYVSRFSYAYLSQAVTQALWRTLGGREGFSPRFDVQGGVGGFGPFFRLAFVASLVVLPFVRLGPLVPMLFTIMATTMAQPLAYVGYARYVPQLYAFPLLVLVAATWCRDRPSLGDAPRRTAMGSSVRAAVGVGYAAMLLAYPLSFFALQWVISQQNLLAVECLQRSAGAAVVTKSYYASHAIKDDCGCSHTPMVSDVAGLSEEASRGPVYRPYFGAYEVHADRPLDWWPDLVHVTSRNDKQIATRRDGRNMSFFVREFLPAAIPRLPSYVWTLARIRLSQLVYRWRPSGGGDIETSAREASDFGSEGFSGAAPAGVSSGR